MSFTDTLLSGILGGVLVWLLSDVIAFLIRRHRVRVTIVADARGRQARLKEVKNFLLALFEKTLMQGQEVSFYFYADSEPFDFYQAVQSDLYKYFWTKELIAVNQFYANLRRVDTLLENIAKDLARWSDKKRVLSKSDLDYLRIKRDRLLSLADILSPEVRTVEDLKRAYDKVPPPESSLQENEAAESKGANQGGS